MTSRGRMAVRAKLGTRKGLAVLERPISYQLVGEVTAHQGFDG